MLRFWRPLPNMPGLVPGIHDFWLSRPRRFKTWMAGTSPAKGFFVGWSMTRALMLQGTGSDVGKSLLVAGLARTFTRRGLRGRPFKPQNMSNNAAVTPDGGEIGRAQALQARAARRAPSVDMNPVLAQPATQ